MGGARSPRSRKLRRRKTKARARWLGWQIGHPAFTLAGQPPTAFFRLALHCTLCCLLEPKQIVVSGAAPYDSVLSLLNPPCLAPGLWPEGSPPGLQDSFPSGVSSPAAQPPTLHLGSSLTVSVQKMLLSWSRSTSSFRSK